MILTEHDMLEKKRGSRNSRIMFLLDEIIRESILFDYPLENGNYINMASRIDRFLCAEGWIWAFSNLSLALR